MDAEQSTHCFELFGFDVLIDDHLKCWLLEVNGSPAIAVGSEVDELVKYPMLNDLIDCIQHQFGFIIPNTKYRNPQLTVSSASSISIGQRGKSRGTSKSTESEEAKSNDAAS